MGHTEQRTKTNPLQFILENNNARLAFLLVLFFVIASITKSQLFLKLDNFQNIMVQMVEYGLMALGCSIAMISGGIDLSTVYIANLSGIIGAMTMQRTVAMGDVVSIFLGIVAAIITGSLCGIFNGILISKLNIPPMLATLGSYQFFMGIAVVITNGSSVAGGNKAYSGLTSKPVLGLFPLAFAVFVVMAIGLAWLMRYTRFGVHTYLVGTNAKASRFAGISNTSVITRVYMTSGILSAVAGLISLSRLNTAKADFGSSYTMLTVLISVLGGVDPSGGSGTVTGVAIAVAALQVISSFLNMFPTISNYYRDLIWGLALIFVLILNHYLEKRKIKKQMQQSK